MTVRKVLLAAAVATTPSLAFAQPMPSVDPSGRQPAPPPERDPDPAPTPAPAQPVVITIGPDGQPIMPAEAPVDDGSFYHYDDQPTFTDDEPSVIHSGAVPELHVIRRGDTLWDICWYYFNDPWQWPKIWSYNPTVTNPHWIYPGDLVRLLPRGMGGTSEPLPDDVEGGGDGNDFEPAPARRFDVKLRQVAFVEQEDLDSTIKIDGSVEAKELLSEGDGVYLTYPDNKPPKVGERYSIYEAGNTVAHPRSGDTAGSYVRILGELEVTSVKKDKKARAIITDSTREIERGALVGPLVRQFKTVPPARNEVDAQGMIIAMLTTDQIIGTGEVVFLDLGEKSGVKVGNRLYVVRRGDALEEDETARPDSNVGQDDRRFPARALGEVVIVEVGKKMSIALVTLAVEEMGAGDLVMMQQTE